jgi:DNA polymerase-3 subunit beta
MLLNFHIKTEKLKEALGRLSFVNDRKPTKAFINNTLFNITSDKCELVATDLEVSVKLILPISSNGEVQFCINTKNFYEIVRELPDGEISFHISDSLNTLNIKCNEINFDLVISSADEFPIINFESKHEPIELNSGELSKFINMTSYAMSSDETRINLNGIFLQKFEDTLRSVAIDGHRMALYEKPNPKLNNNYLMEGIIIPRKGISELKRLAESNLDTPIAIFADDSFIYAKLKNEYFIAVRLISREYPNYSSVIPSKVSYSFTINKVDLFNGLKRIRILANEKTNAIKFNILKDSLMLSAHNSSMGQASEKIFIDYNGSPFEIGFNAKYLLDTLNVLDDGLIKVEFNNELSPVIIKSNEDPYFIGIVMPLKI